VEPIHAISVKCVSQQVALEMAHSQWKVLQWLGNWYYGLCNPRTCIWK